DVFENFRNLTMKCYGLDAAAFVIAPSLSWSAALKITKIKLKLLTDIEMLLFIEKGIRGGITQSVKRYAKANNKYCPNFNSNVSNSYLIYLDVRNLYGWAQGQS